MIRNKLQKNMALFLTGMMFFSVIQSPFAISVSAKNIVKDHVTKPKITSVKTNEKSNLQIKVLDSKGNAEDYLDVKLKLKNFDSMPNFNLENEITKRTDANGIVNFLEIENYIKEYYKKALENKEPTESTLNYDENKIFEIEVIVDRLGPLTIKIGNKEGENVLDINKLMPILISREANPFVNGRVSLRKADGTKEYVENAEITIDGKTALTDYRGEYSFSDMKIADIPKEKEEVEIIITDSEKYEGVKELRNITKINDFELLEKFTANNNNIKYGANISPNGYVAKEGSYNIIGLDGLTLSTKPNGEFSTSINVKVTKTGCEDVYVKGKNGYVSNSPLSNLIKIDNVAPNITAITNIKDNKGNSIKFYDYGIFSKEAIDISLSMSIEENDSGLNNKKTYIESINKDGKKTIYNCSSTTKTLEGYVSDFLISSEAAINEETLYVVAVDNVGNKSKTKLLKSLPDPSTLTIENELPVIGTFEIEGQKTGSWYRGSLGVNVAAKDRLAGLKRISLWVNGNNVNTYELSKKTNEEVKKRFNIGEDFFKTNESTNDKYLIKIIVEDNCGNIKEVEKEIKVDAKAPEITFENVEDGGAYKVAPNIVVKNSEKNLTEEGNEVELILKKENKEVFRRSYKNSDSIPIDIKHFTENGEYELIVTAKDEAQNSSVRSLKFYIDNLVPTISNITAIGKLESGFNWYSGEIFINAKIADEISGFKTATLAINGEPVLTKSYSEMKEPVKAENIEFRLTEELINKYMNMQGDYKATIHVEDKAGNVTMKEQTFNIDLVNPNISISGIIEGIITNQKQTLVIETDEKFYDKEGAKINVVTKLNGKTISNEDYPKQNKITITYEKDGYYEIFVNSNDAAGNKSLEKRVRFTYDTSKPVIKTTKRGKIRDGLTWYYGPVTFTMNNTDETSGIESTIVKINGREETSFAGHYAEGNKSEHREITISNNLIDKYMNNNGSYEVTYIVKDRAGNVATYTEEKVYIDNVNPVLTISGIEKNKFYKNSPTLKIENNEKHYAEPEAMISIEKTINGKTITKTFKSKRDLFYRDFKTDGKYELKVGSIDAAGNTSEIKTIKFFKDSHAPTISVDGVENGAYYNKSKTLRVNVDDANLDKSKTKCILKRDLNGRVTNVPFNTKGTTTLMDVGVYTLHISATDMAGNVNSGVKMKFTIDNKKPEIIAKNFKEKPYSYKDNINAKIYVKDDYLEDFNYRLIRLDGVKIKQNEVIKKDGNVLYLVNTKKEKYDGVYELKVMAKDRAGNINSKIVKFTLNRYGSIFEYDNIVDEINGRYLKKQDKAIIIKEKNSAKVIKRVVEIKKDGKVIEAKVDTNKIEDKVYEYAYTHLVSAENFKDEGIYEVNIISTDENKNTVNSKKKTGAIIFVVDKTAPTIITSGLDDNFIKASSHKVEIAARDNLGEAHLDVTLNGKPVPPNQIKATETGIGCELLLKEGKNQEIKINVVDEAGNKTSETKTITVSTNLILFIFSNKILLSILFGSMILLLIGANYFLNKKREEDELIMRMIEEDEEDEE